MMTIETPILVVDDDESFQRTLCGILQAKGYTPTALATGQEALEYLETSEPAVVLLDLNLGDMAGLDVMKAIRERYPNSQCIVLTGHASQSSAIEAVNLGAYSYVQKPCEVEHLLLTIRRAVCPLCRQAAPVGPGL